MKRPARAALAAHWASADLATSLQQMRDQERGDPGRGLHEDDEPVSQLQSTEDASVDYLQRLLGSREAAMAQPVSHLAELESSLDAHPGGAQEWFAGRSSSLSIGARRLNARRRPAYDWTSRHAPR